MYEYKHFRLVGGEEILCEVIEWIEEQHNEIIVRDVMAIVPSLTSTNEKVYVFKPWLHYIEGKEELIIINSAHVVATVTPNPILLEQYLRAVVEMHLTAADRISEQMLKTQRKFADIANSLKEIFDEDEYGEFDGDSDASNIIKFPPVH